MSRVVNVAGDNHISISLKYNINVIAIRLRRGRSRRNIIHLAKGCNAGDCHGQAGLISQP
jgi:hypothetical protein